MHVIGLPVEQPKLKGFKGCFKHECYIDDSMMKSSIKVVTVSIMFSKSHNYYYDHAWADMQCNYVLSMLGAL